MMAMKKVYWAIQSLWNAGGTEAVSVQLMNLLCPYYDIILLSVCASDKKPVHDLDPRIKVITLGVAEDVGRFDQSWATYGAKHPFKRLSLFFRTFSIFLRRFPLRRKMSKLIEKDAIFVTSSLDNYILSPRNRTCFYHYHFDARKFLGVFDTLARIFYRKPDKYIFLAKKTQEEIEAKKKYIRCKSAFVHNPIRISFRKNEEYHDNAILFVGRYTEQKDPMLALAIAKELSARNFPYTLRMIGEGHLEKEMRECVAENHLENVIIDGAKQIEAEDYLQHDLLLITSRYEGFSLVKGEANRCGLPAISTPWDGPIEEVFLQQGDGQIGKTRDPKEYADMIMEWLSSEKKAMENKKRCSEAAASIDSEEDIVAAWRSILG